MKTLDGKRIAILISDGTDRDGLMLAREALIIAGADTVLVSPQSGTVVLAASSDADERIEADVGLDHAEDYDALVVPGGQNACRLLLEDQSALGFIDSFPRSGRPVAALGHGVLPVLRNGEFAGHRVSAAPGMEKCVDDAGAAAEDRLLVADRGLLTCQESAGLTDFNNAMVERFALALETSPGEPLPTDA